MEKKAFGQMHALGLITFEIAQDPGIRFQILARHLGTINVSQDAF